MKDLVLKDPVTGYAYLAKADIGDMSPEEVIAKLRMGLLPFKLYLNEDDIEQNGDQWNKANVLPQEVVERLQLQSMENPQVKDALLTLCKVEEVSTSILTKGSIVNSFKNGTRINLIGKTLLEINIVADVRQLSVENGGYYHLATISPAYSIYYPSPNEYAPLNSFSVFAEYGISSGDEVFMRTRSLACTLDKAYQSNTVNQICIYPGETNLPASTITARLIYPVQK